MVPKQKGNRLPVRVETAQKTQKWQQIQICHERNIHNFYNNVKRTNVEKCAADDTIKVNL